MKARTKGLSEMTAAMAVSGTIGWLVLASDQTIVSLVFWRCVFGALALAPVCLAFDAYRGTVTRRVVGHAALGGVALVANWLLLFAAFPRASISIATAVYSLQPFVLVLLGAAFLGERLSSAKMAWLALAFCGVVAITQSAPSASYVGSDYLTGVALAFGAAVFYALASIAAKKLAGTPPHLIALVQVGVGALVLLPFIGRADIPTDAGEWTRLVALGVIYTGLVFTLQYGAIQKLPTHDVGALYYVYPVVAIIVDVMIFQHRPQILEMLGMVTILTAAAGMTFFSNSRGAERASLADAAVSRVPTSRNSRTDQQETFSWNAGEDFTTSSVSTAVDLRNDRRSLQGPAKSYR